MSNLSKKLIISAVSAALILPALAGAVDFNPPAGAGFNVISIATLVLNLVWIVAVVFFIVMFIIAGFQFFNAKGDAEGLADARRNAIYGVVGLVVAVLGWSMIQVVKSYLGQ
jgi:heme/copper-type cytochrome/quinol oxidase subunit 2